MALPVFAHHRLTRPGVFFNLLGTLFFILLFILFEQALFSQEQTSAISDVEKRINQIDQQISNLKSRLKEEERRENSLLSSMEKIRLNKKLLQNEIAAINLRHSLANQELNELKKKLATTQRTLQKEKESMDKILVTLYRFGRLDFMHFFLRADNLETFLRESKNLSFLARHQEEAINNYLKTLAELEATEKEVQEKIGVINSLLQEAKTKQARLVEEENKNQKLLAEIKKNKSTYQKMMTELQESSEELQKLLRRLQTQEISLPSPFIPLNERRGQLPWPVGGKVTSRFGKEKHPKFNTVTVNNGIKIVPTGQDKTIKAVHAGRVVFADYFQGYGNLIIIDHGLSYHTLYGHCANFLVQKGDLVKAGQPLAEVGDSDSLDGECLYFEIRHKAQAVDPLKWLKR